MTAYVGSLSFTNRSGIEKVEFHRVGTLWIRDRCCAVFCSGRRAAVTVVDLEKCDIKYFAIVSLLDLIDL